MLMLSCCCMQTVVCANFNCLPVKQGAMGKPVPGYDIDVSVSCWPSVRH